MDIRASSLAAALLTAAATTGAQAPAAAPDAKSQRAELKVQDAPWKGDLDGMAKRRRIRALVVRSRTAYFLEKGQQGGTSYEFLKAFEDDLNKRLKTGKLRVHVVIIPTSRDRLLPALNEGRADLAVAELTITPERERVVDFSEPFFRGVKEVVVTGPQSPNVAALDDLAGQEVFARRSSSYWQHLENLNRKFAAAGKPAVKLRPAPETLEDEDLLEMLNAGLFKIAVVDRYMALLWAKIFKGITPHEDVAVNEGGEFAWAFRKQSPRLKAGVDAFAKSHGQGTLFGNTIVKRYIGSTRFVKDATSPAEIKKFQALVDLFRTYAGKYELDALLVMAQGYQESRLDNSVKSRVGAVGVMQVMPATGREMKVGDIRQLEPNIHAGVKYIRFMEDQYFANEPMDPVNKALFAFASYNAGPGRVRQLRRLAKQRGLDPNVWFNNVEVIAAERIGAETVTYVSNIYKYYLAYKLVVEDMEQRQKARDTLMKPS